jgi:dihydropteroate synthase
MTSAGTPGTEGATRSTSAPFGAAVPRHVTLEARQHTFALAGGRPAVMGIINTNPGSFSDTEHLASLDRQLARAEEFVAQGADIIDVGTDSGVTYGASIPLEQQVAAAVPLVEALVARGIPVSIDTPYATVARATLEAGACMINDVSGLADLEIARLCAQHDASLVILHTRVGHKQEAFLPFPDVVADIEELFEERTAMAVEQGVRRDRVVLDPGLGYSKHPHDDVRLLRAYDTFAARGLAILTGASRKLFAGVITGAPPTDRLPETLATVAAVRHVPGFVRVHDVGAVRAFLDVAAQARW